MSPLLSDPSKSRGTQGKSEFQNNFGQAHPSFEIPGIREEKPRFEEFLGPLKIAGNREKIQILSPVHRRKAAKNFGRARPSKSQDTVVKSAFCKNFGSQKIAGAAEKSKISSPVHPGKNRE
jgi:hypothetical protein